MSVVLGLSALYHDAAACLIQDGVIVAAAQEERFTRRKFDPSLPLNAFRACLAQAGLNVGDIDCVAFHDEPRAKLGRIAWSLGAGIGDLRSLLETWEHKTSLEAILRESFGVEGPIHFVPHHTSHAASSYLLSGFDDAAILVADGVGEWATTTRAVGRDGQIEILDEVIFPHSLGLFYSAVTSFLGFDPNSDEYKVMGMAAYGKPRYREALARVLRVEADGRYTLDMTYFDYNRGMYSAALGKLLGVAARERGEPLDQVHMDVACSAQQLLEEALLTAARWLHARTGMSRLCLAGGVALNCLANARLRDETPFTDIFIQPAAGDAGGCLGAAAFVANRLDRRRPRALAHCYLGPAFTDAQIEVYLRRMGVVSERLAPGELTERVAALLADGQIVGWFQGRMELGPRALGARSILADPRRAEMKDIINEKIKHREQFRPFAPICLPEHAPRYFTVDRPYPYMTFTVAVKDPDAVAAACHVDATARLQTVDAEQAPELAALLRAFGARTGVPVLINTSFNVSGEPIVCSPGDAFNCFRESGIDALAIGSFLVERRHQPSALVEPGSRAYMALAREVEPYLRDTYFFT